MSGRMRFEQGKRFTQPQVERLALRLSMAEEYLRSGEDWLVARVVAEAAEIVFGPAPTPERHRDGPDQRLADLPDPMANTFDPKEDNW